MTTRKLRTEMFLQDTIKHLANRMTADLEIMREIHTVGTSSLGTEDRLELVRAIDAILTRREMAAR